VIAPFGYRHLPRRSPIDSEGFLLLVLRGCLWYKVLKEVAYPYHPAVLCVLKGWKSTGYYSMFAKARAWMHSTAPTEVPCGMHISSFRYGLRGCFQKSFYRCE